MKNNKKKVLVFGGTGFLGYYVLRALAETGADTGIVIRRKLDDIEIPTEGYKIFVGNIFDVESVKKAVSDFTPDVIVNLTGIVSEKKPKITFDRVYIEGTQNIVSAAKEAEVAKIISVSVLGADENSSIKYFRAKAKAERVIQNSSMDWVIFRPSIMFGWRSGFNSMIVKPAKRLLFIPMAGGGYHKIQPVAAPVVADAIAQACMGVGRSNMIYEVAGPEVLTVKEATERVREAMKSSKPIMKIPLWLISFLKIMNETQIAMLTGNYGSDADEFKKDFNVADMYFDPLQEHPLF